MCSVLTWTYVVALATSADWAILKELFNRVETMPFCSECGAKVKKQTKFCSQCGKSLIEEETDWRPMVQKILLVVITLGLIAVLILLLAEFGIIGFGGSTLLSYTAPPAPRITINIVGCTTGWDLNYGEITNVFVEIVNTGDGDATNILLSATATDEDSPHPGRRATVPSLSPGHSTTMKLVLDTAYQNYGTVTVTAQGNNFASKTAYTNNCALIDETSIENLNIIAKYGLPLIG